MNGPLFERGVMLDPVLEAAAEQTRAVETLITECSPELRRRLLFLEGDELTAALVGAKPATWASEAPTTSVMQELDRWSQVTKQPIALVPALGRPDGPGATTTLVVHLPRLLEVVEQYPDILPVEFWLGEAYPAKLGKLQKALPALFTQDKNRRFGLALGYPRNAVEWFADPNSSQRPVRASGDTQLFGALQFAGAPNVDYTNDPAVQRHLAILRASNLLPTLESLRTRYQPEFEAWQANQSQEDLW